MVTVKYVLGVTALAFVLAFGILPAGAGASGVSPTPDHPGAGLLSGVRGCAPALSDSVSEGSRCLVRWSVNDLLLNAAAQLATEQGRAVFGKHFRIANNLYYSPTGNGPDGGVDVVLPLASLALHASTPSALSAFFLQKGLTRWVDDRGSSRNDYRVGAVRRFGISGLDAESGILGVSVFVQQSHEYQHTRIVAGADYAGRWGRGSLNLFVPTTGWRPGPAGYEERALAGTELGLRLDLTTTLSINTAVGRWEEDGLSGWSTRGRMAVGWRPHPWFNLNVGWSGLGTKDGKHTLRLAFSMPLGNPRGPTEWKGLGLVGGGTEPTTTDAWSPVENIGVIKVARRNSRGDRGIPATVRFLQDRARSGDQISVEVHLPAVTSRDLDLVVTLAPGTGENPAVPGIDYVDQPIPVTIRAGTSSTVVSIQLPLNASLNEARSLKATVAMASRS